MLVKIMFQTLIFLGLSFECLADDSITMNEASQQFTNESAERAFTNARLPGLQEVLGTWILVGLADEDNPNNVVSPSYFPGGKYSIKGSAGYFKFVSAYTSTKDIFDQDLIQVNRRAIGVETGKDYNDETSVIRFSEKSILFMDTISDDCHIANSCRVVDRFNYLICKKKTVEKINCDRHGISSEYYTLHSKLSNP